MARAASIDPTDEVVERLVSAALELEREPGTAQVLPQGTDAGVAAEDERLEHEQERPSTSRSPDGRAAGEMAVDSYARRGLTSRKRFQPPAFRQREGVPNDDETSPAADRRGGSRRRRARG